MDNITNAEKKVDVYNKSMRLWMFLQKMEFERNPHGRRTDIRRSIHSSMNRLSGKWTFNKENSLGYRLHTSSNFQTNNKTPPDSFRLSLTAPIMDEKHLKDILESARVDAIKDGMNLKIDKNSEELKEYVSIVGLINNPISLPVSPSELNELYNINPENINLADENHGKIIVNPNNKNKLLLDPEALFTIYDFMQEKELKTQTINKDVIKFAVGNNVNNLGNISYSINNNSEYFDIVISGDKEKINNLVSIPRFDEERSLGFNPKISSIEFTGIPLNISPAEMIETLDGIHGNKKTIRVLLDEKSDTYVNDCRYINNIYEELMIVNPEEYTLEIYDNYSQNGKKEVFSNTHAPGAAYNERISQRPQFKYDIQEKNHEISNEL